jgi:hypothetical protein
VSLFEEALNALPEGEAIRHSLATDVEQRWAYALVWSRNGVVTSVQVIGHYVRLDKKRWQAVGLANQDLGIHKRQKDATTALIRALGRPA